MKKIPTLFKRDPNNMRFVTREPHPDCLWVLAGEGWPTAKLDGTCCLIRNGHLYRRRELKQGQDTIAGWEPAQETCDPITGKFPGWVPVGDGKEDRYHREAWDALEDRIDGTYELLGPKVQGNPENRTSHTLEPHGRIALPDVARSFTILQALLSNFQYEGIVWHHPDGRMAKLKVRDFGFKRSTREAGRHPEEV